MKLLILLSALAGVAAGVDVGPPAIPDNGTHVEPADAASHLRGGIFPAVLEAGDGVNKDVALVVAEKTYPYWPPGGAPGEIMYIGQEVESSSIPSYTGYACAPLCGQVEVISIFFMNPEHEGYDIAKCQWQFSGSLYFGGGGGVISNVGCPGTVMEISGNRCRNGQKIHLYADNAGRNQRWRADGTSSSFQLTLPNIWCTKKINRDPQGNLEIRNKEDSWGIATKHISWGVESCVRAYPRTTQNDETVYDWLKIDDRAVTIKSENYPNKSWYIPKLCVNWYNLKTTCSIKHVQVILGDAAMAFKQAPGLTAPWGSVSIEDATRSGYYLRHRDGKMYVEQNDGSCDFIQSATFTTHRSLGSGSPAGFFSLQSVNKPGHYIRHEHFQLLLDSREDNDLFNKDSSFQFVLKA